MWIVVPRETTKKLHKEIQQNTTDGLKWKTEKCLKIIQKKTIKGKTKRKSRLNITNCSIPGLGRSPGEGNGNPIQYSCLWVRKQLDNDWVTNTFTFTWPLPAKRPSLPSCDNKIGNPGIAKCPLGAKLPPVEDSGVRQRFIWYDISSTSNEGKN